MMPKEIVLVTGGCRSGKSSYAQSWAENRSSRRLFLATARVTDEEMAERIRRHQEVRGEGWITAEEPVRVQSVIREQGSAVPVVLLDCVTVWVSNLLREGLTDEEILSSQLGDLITALGEVPCSIVMVTNEVGWGIVPEYPLGRRFRDLAGMVNQNLARAADRVVLMAAGLPLTLKGE